VLTFGTLCSGIGGIDLGLERAGMECQFAVEIDPQCRNILRRHFPNALLLGDMTTVGKHNLPRVDVLAGGTPCQGFSVAGLRGSLDDDRSNLCLQFVRIANELNPGILLWENVNSGTASP
jgi:DNA (cytosine-5)-methyltransferase 1